MRIQEFEARSYGLAFHRGPQKYTNGSEETSNVEETATYDRSTEPHDARKHCEFHK